MKVEDVPLWLRVTGVVHESLRTLGVPTESIFFGIQRVVDRETLTLDLAWCVTIEADDGPGRGPPRWCFVVERFVDEADEPKYVEAFRAFLPQWNGPEHAAFREAVFDATPFERVPFVWSLVTKGIIGGDHDVDWRRT